MAATEQRIRVGQRAARTLTLTKKEVAAYAEMTGDRNPLHFDEAFAARTKFERLVVHGGLTAGILNALVAAVTVGRPYDVSPEGQRFLAIKAGAGADESATQRTYIVTNWFEELRQRMGSN